MHISKRAASVVAAACASVVGCAAFGASYGQTATASFMNNSNSFNTTALANAINLANGYTGSTEIEIEGFGTVQLTGALPALSTPGSITISGDGGIIFAAPGTDASETSPGNGPPVFNGATPGLTALNVTNGNLTILASNTFGGGNGGNDNIAAAVFVSENLSGGVGVAFGSSGILSIGGSIAGGNGGYSAANRGGDGGAGVVANSANASVRNTGIVAGGAGGQGTSSGGNGGAGMQFNAFGFVINSGTVIGGNGAQAVGAPGNGGAGINFSGGGSLNNSGTITGGSGQVATYGNPGSNGGNAVAFSGGGSVINSGTITGGTGGSANDGNPAGTAGAAILITGGVGTFTNLNHGVINGNVTLDNFANNVTLQIGSTISGDLNVGTSTLSTLTLTDDGTGGTGTYSSSVGSTQFSGQLIKTGNGEWVMDQALGYLGGTVLNAGTLSVSQDSNLGNTSGSLSFNGGVLQVTGTSFNSTSRTISWGTNGGGIDVANAGNTFTVSQSLSSGGTLTKFGEGTLVLGGSADNVGLGAVVNTGTLVLNKSSSSTSVHAIGGGGLVINSGGAVQLAGSNGDQIYDGGGVTINGGAFDLNGNTETIATLNGASGSVTNSNSSASGVLTVSGGGAFGGVFGTLGNGISITVTGQTLTLSGSADNSYLGATVNGGTLVLAKASSSGTHAIGGGVTINTGGTVQLAGSGGDQIYDSNTVTLNGGTFDMSGRSETIGPLYGNAGVVTNNNAGTLSTLTISGGGSFGGSITDGAGSLALAKTGTNTLTLTGSTINYSGSTSVAGGTLQIGDGTHAISLAGADGVNVEGGSDAPTPGVNGITVALASTVTVSANANVRGGSGGGNYGTGPYQGQAPGIGIVFSSVGTLNNAGTIRGGDAEPTNSSFAANGAAAVTFAASGSSFENVGAISGGNGGSNPSGAAGNGGVGVEFSQSGTWSNSGSISGGSAGSSYSNSNSVGAAGVQLDNGGSFTNTGTIIGGVGGAAASSGGTGGNGITFGSGGTITNAGTIQAGSGGTPQLNGSTGAGGIGISMTGGVGTFTNQNHGAISGNVTLGNYANNVTLQIGSTINGNLNVGTSSSASLNLTDDGSGGTQYYSHAVTGSTQFNGQINKQGTGTWIMDRSISLQGDTNIYTGTLVASAGTTFANRWILQGGKVMGSGQIGILNATNGTVEPGLGSGGTLSVGALYSNAATLLIDVNGASPGTYGSIASTDPSNLSGLNLQFNLNYALASGDSLQIYTGVIAASLPNVSDGQTFDMGAFDGLEYYGSVRYGDGVALDDFFTEPLPEPASATGLIIATSGLLMRRRRRATSIR